MNKNKFTFSILVLIMSLSFYGCGNDGENNSSSQDPEHVYVGAKTDSYETIEELEQASDLIVIGSKTKELESNVEYDENGVYQIAYTYSSFKIDEVISNKVEETEKSIRIFENQAFDKKHNEVLHIAGYTNMIIGNKYILYLKQTDENYYIPLAVTFGKVPLTNSEINSDKLKMRDNDSDSKEVIENLHKQIQKKYDNKVN